MGSSVSQLTAPTVVIVGGGPVGLFLASKLDDSGKFNVLVIEKRAFTVWPLSLHRASVVPGWQEKSTLPYHQALKRGSVIQAEVTRVDADGVHIAGRAPIQADYTVICVGAQNSIHPRTSSLNEARSYYAGIQKSLADSKRVVVIGAGAVGIELAGEIAAQYTGTNAKEITLIGRDAKIMPAVNFSDKARKELLEKLTKAGVKFLGEKSARVVEAASEAKTDGASASVAPPAAGPMPTQYARFGELSVLLSTGESLRADAVFTCTGVQFNSTIYRDYLAAAVTENGRIRVNEFFQPVAVDQATRRGALFAVGDCADAEPIPTLFSGKVTAEALAANLVRLVEKKAMKPYVKSTVRAAFLHLGLTGGVGYYGSSEKDPESGYVIGDFVVKMAKGKDLMTPAFLKSVDSGKGVKNRALPLSKLLHVDEAAAAPLLSAATP